MGSIEIELFTTLDLVGQAPGGPEEDPEGGFAFGGWQAPLLDDVAGAQIAAAYEGTDALLLGRRTYDIFASYWPFQEGGQDDDFATLFNRIPKYVASRGTPDLPWAGSTLLGRTCPPRCTRCATGTRTSRSWGASTWCRRCCARGCSTGSTCGCTPSCSARARPCSTAVLSPPTSRSSNRRRPAPLARSCCATASATARRARVT